MAVDHAVVEEEVEAGVLVDLAVGVDGADVAGLGGEGVDALRLEANLHHRVVVDLILLFDDA